MQHRQNWECFVCFPDDLAAHSCAPSAPHLRRVHGKAEIYLTLSLYWQKKLAQTASREKCGPLVLNQSIHTSLYSAVSTQNLQFRRQIWLPSFSSVWRRSLSPRYHPSAQPRSWDWLQLPRDQLPMYQTETEVQQHQGLCNGWELVKSCVSSTHTEHSQTGKGFLIGKTFFTTWWHSAFIPSRWKIFVYKT